MSPKPAQNAWIKALIPIMDEGDYGERSAPAGAIGRVDSVDERGTDGPRFHVVFYPSGITNVFEAEEVDRDIEILPPQSPEIPSLGAVQLVDATLDIFYSGQIDEDAATVSIGGDLTRRLEIAQITAPTSIQGPLQAVLSRSASAIPFGDVDSLAEAVGVGDRLVRPAPSPRP